MLQRPASLAPLLNRTWGLLIADESHFAKTFTAKRTQALFGGPSATAPNSRPCARSACARSGCGA